MGALHTANDVAIYGSGSTTGAVIAGAGALEKRFGNPLLEPRALPPILAPLRAEGNPPLGILSPPLTDGAGDADALVELPFRAMLSAAANAEIIPADGERLMPLLIGLSEVGTAIGESC